MEINVYFDTVISILLGALIGLVVYRVYICPKVIRGPNSKDIVDKIFEIDGKYYELEPIICGCLKS